MQFKTLRKFTNDEQRSGTYHRGEEGAMGGINSKIETKGILRSPSPGVGFSLIWTYTSFSCQDFLDEGAPLPLHFKKNDDRCPQRTTVGGMNAIFSLHYLNNSSDLHVKVTGNCNRYKINKIRHSTISNIFDLFLSILYTCN